jgi:hypothetical protein
VNVYTCRFAEKFIVCRLVQVLKAPPATHVVDQDGLEPWIAADHVVKKLPQAKSVFQDQSARGSV